MIKPYKKIQSIVQLLLKILKKYPSINKKKSVELDILLLINTLNKEKQKFLMTLDTYFFDKCNLEYYVFKKKTIIRIIITDITPAT